MSPEQCEHVKLDERPRESTEREPLSLFYDMASGYVGSLKRLVIRRALSVRGENKPSVARSEVQRDGI